MSHEDQIAMPRFKVFLEKVIEPAVFPAAVGLNVSVFQCTDHLSPDTIAALDADAFRAVSIGWRWGPRWSTAWFKVRGEIPDAFAGREAVFRFSSGTEAQVWDRGEPTQGLDANRDVFRLVGDARGGEPIDLLIEAACNHRLGLSLFEWDSPAFRQRWQEDLPGWLERCEVAVIDERVRRLASTYAFTRLLLEDTPPDSVRFGRLERALDEATRLIDAEDVGASAEAADETLKEALSERNVRSLTRCFAVGHGHLDTAWLWRTCETKRKCVRTFSTVLALMDRFPTFRFLCSQPQQYAWVKDNAPLLFERICERVQEGRWEPMGAMWIEPDGNLPGGESFVRQILMGTRFFEQAFGERGRQRLLYLPDTFGFAGSLPQIMKLAGIDTFITNKLWWNETNVFPFTTFAWEGIDGSQVLSHLTPGQEYNATNTPTELLRGQRLSEKHDTAVVGVWLQPYGFGDGGGGPTDWTIEYAQLARDCAGLAETLPDGVAAFCEALHAQAARVGAALPMYEGELYLEKHRGTYTTQARIKRDNVEAEASLRIAEWLCFAGPTGCDIDPNAHEALTEAWKLVLLNQFHDILPGSSIGEVYEDALVDHAIVRETCQRLIRHGANAWARTLLGQAEADSAAREHVAVFNPTSRTRSGWVVPGDNLARDKFGAIHGESKAIYVRDVPALGMKIVDGSADETLPGMEAAWANSQTLSNGIIKARIDGNGRIASLVHVKTGRDVVQADDGAERAGRLGQTGRGLNQLVLYDDQPQQWEAWDIDADYVDSAQPITTTADDICAGEDQSGPFVRVSRPLGTASRIVQTYRLRSGSPRLDIETWVDWRERRRLLRALFPVNVCASTATYEIPFGHITRSTLRETSFERARFEVPAHRWMDVSEAGVGVALLNDCKYGHSCERDEGGVCMGLTLLRGPNFPDPNADLGEHTFTYSLMPHSGDWRRARVDHEAEWMVSPMFAVRVATTSQETEATEIVWSPLRIEPLGEACPRVTALKRAEDGRHQIVRLVEWHGKGGVCRIQWGFAVKSVEPVNLLERPMSLESVRHDTKSGVTTIDFKPFQIVTLAVRTP
jgi:alpha-mannosidase